ncbi:septum site-determining protein MinC [Metabacillus iocasae]|uniref:Probable septum site-determining protein MinC n=1 Tax=Priestia iocasae TaxID=2291674 RepID=A0ABS2QPJ0_9BACI|nr:septum site-determining protein MinC [Metabacillus iocasae]
MNKQKQQYVTIKGTKDGLTLHLDDTCSFQELLNELDSKLSTNQHGDNDQFVAVHVKVGNRYLSAEQEEELKTIIRKKRHLVVGEIDCNVILKEDALRLKEENEIVSVAKVIRSGQVLHVPGDLLLVGDVNPGGKVIAGGNIFIIGALKGIAHAGYYDNKQAVIAASVMKPSQLRISDIITRANDERDDSTRNEMECAYLNEENQMVIERVQLLSHLRPHLTSLERSN